MSVRANSLPRVLLDGVFFAVSMGLASAAMTVFAQDTQPRAERVADVVTDRRLTDDHVDSQLNTDDNMPSGDPAESAEGKREANMLGMKLYEVRTGHIRVDEVAATSPAWDAGVRRGDRLISVDTLRPRSLAPWVQEVSRILKDTPDGNSVAAAVERDGETLSLRIRVPFSKAAEVRDARQEERAIANMAGGNSQQMQQLGQQGVMPVDGGDTGGNAAPYGNSGYGGWGMGGFFGGGEANSGNNSGGRMATNAVAQLMSVNTFDQGVPTGTAPAQENNAQSQGMQAGGRQIGIAGFQDNGQGVRAAVVVRGLPPGMYQVGIGQGDVGGGVGNMGSGGVGNAGFGVGVGNEGLRNNTGNNNVGNRRRESGAGGLNDFDPNGAANPNQSLPHGARPIERPGVQQPTNNQRPETPFFPQRPSPGGSPAPAGGTGGGGTGGGSATGGAGGASGASLASPNGMPVLAQQLDATSDAMLNDPSRRGATQQVQTGNPVRARNNNQALNGAAPFGANNNPNNLPAGGNPTGGQGSPQFVAEIGVLRVGQDGSGSVEKQLEGMQVQSLAGMSVMVVSPQAQATPTGQGGNSGGQFPAGAEGPQPIGGQADRGRNLPNQAIGGGMNGIVATGTIQVMESGAAANSAFDDSANQTGNQTPDNSGTEQLRNRNQTAPPADFDPRSTGQ